jgi:hypothetical protein
MRASLEYPETNIRRTRKVSTPGTSSKGSQNIAEWLPLLGSIVQALRGMPEDARTADDRTADDPTAERNPVAMGDDKTSPGATAR